MEKASGLTLITVSSALGFSSPDIIASIALCGAAALGGLMLSLKVGWRRNIKVLFGSFIVGATTSLVTAIHAQDYMWAGPLTSVLVSYSPQVLDKLIHALNKKVGG